MLKRVVLIAISIFLLKSCASSFHGVSKTDDTYIKDISIGLPISGLWRQNIELYDIDKTGFFEIIVPPPRKASDQQRRPYIFYYDNNEQKWKESEVYKYPFSKEYNYGAIAIGDINKDGFYDLVLANHERKILILINDKKNNFEIITPIDELFRSRTVLIEDMDGDGWLDIIALSEFFNPNQKDLKTGIMVGLNNNGIIKPIFIDGTEYIFGDSFAVGDINGDGKKDIIIAPLTGIKELKKSIWLNDGKGKFKYLNLDIFTEREIPFFVRTGDIDGDNIDEMVFKISPLGVYGSTYLKAFKHVNGVIENISSGLEEIKDIGVFDIADIDNDGKNELGLLTKESIIIYKYSDKKWVKSDEYKINTINDLNAVFDFKMRRQYDGSVLFVFNCALESNTENGIKAYRMVKSK